MIGVQLLFEVGFSSGYKSAVHLLETSWNPGTLVLDYGLSAGGGLVKQLLTHSPNKLTL